MKNGEVQNINGKHSNPYPEYTLNLIGGTSLFLTR